MAEAQPASGSRTARTKSNGLSMLAGALALVVTFLVKAYLKAASLLVAVRSRVDAVLEPPEYRTAHPETSGFVSLGQAKVDAVDARTSLPIQRMVQMIGGAVVLIAIIVVVVNAVLTTDAVANSSGPFSPVIGDLETTGVAAMGLLVIGLLVAAGMWIMRIMDFGGGGGGGF